MIDFLYAETFGVTNGVGIILILYTSAFFATAFMGRALRAR